MTTSFIVSHNPCFFSMTKRVDDNKTHLDQETIESIIDVLPETQEIKKIVDNFYNQLHDDKQISRFSAAFVEILKLNPE